MLSLLPVVVKSTWAARLRCWWASRGRGRRPPGRRSPRPQSRRRTEAWHNAWVDQPSAVPWSADPHRPARRSLARGRSPRRPSADNSRRRRHGLACPPRQVPDCSPSSIAVAEPRQRRALPAAAMSRRRVFADVSSMVGSRLMFQPRSRMAAVIAQHRKAALVMSPAGFVRAVRPAGLTRARTSVSMHP